MKKLLVYVALVFGLLGGEVFAQKADKLIGTVAVGEVTNTLPRKVPMLLWGGEGPLFIANGGVTTLPASIYGKMGLNYQLIDGNDPVTAARGYLEGTTPFFRGTFVQACLFAEVFNRDPRTKPVCILQMTYSLGDHMVYREEESNVKKNQDGSISIVKPTQLQDLKSKKIRIAAQEGGPHLSMIHGSLSAGGMSWSDIQMVWCKNLTGENSPAEKLRNGEADIACVITPDMIGLCSGLDSIGSGAEGTVLGSRVINTTATMSQSIADNFFCRKDFYDANRDEIEKFVVGYLQATEQVVAARKAYDQPNAKPDPAYQTMMKQMQDFFGAEVLPTIEQDVHGLLLDANFVRIPGNEIFFQDPNNKTGFEDKLSSGMEIAKILGYISKPQAILKPDWDFKNVSTKAGVAYTEPVYSSGRIKAEVNDFMEDLDSTTIFSFEIKFKSNQVDFPLEEYADEFDQFFKAQREFRNSATIIQGHSDPTLTLKHFFWAAKAKGLINGDEGSYTFNGKPLSLTDTESVMLAIQSSNLAGQSRRDSSGKTVEIPDPRETVNAALATSQVRAKNAKESAEKFAKENGYQVDLEAVFPQGVGIADPLVARPMNMIEAEQNMRVIFRVIRVQAEAINENDFDFDKE